jgi:hypothetical protein
MYSLLNEPTFMVTDYGHLELTERSNVNLNRHLTGYFRLDLCILE